MTRFSVGEQVIVRFGSQQGQKAKIIKNLPRDAYKVKVDDGSVRFFSGKGLEKDNVSNAAAGSLAPVVEVLAIKSFRSCRHPSWHCCGNGKGNSAKTSKRT
jgi:hypothetical protein